MASAPVQTEPISLASRRKRQEPGALQVPQESPAWRARVFFGAEVVLASSLLVTQAPALQGAILVFMVLLALDVVADMNPINIYGDSHISVSFVFLSAIIILFGVPGAVIAGPIEAFAYAAVKRRFTHWEPHNAAMFTIVYATGASVYQFLAPVNPAGFEAMMVPAIILATAASFCLNALMVGTFGALRVGEPIRDFWSKHSWLAPHYLAFGLTGLALALGYVALGVPGLLAFVAPALLIRVAMRQYVDKTKDNVEKLKAQNTQLVAANIEISRVSEELRLSYDGTLEALVNALDARDQETKGHSIRVSRYMMDIAREMGVVEGTQEWIDMARGSLLHDVGKIGITDSILLKPGKLTDEEWGTMRKHPEIGYQMLRQVKFLEGAAEIILAHHERWDGGGYPHALRELEIPLGARIFTVVDTFDSMTSDRPYRSALSTQEALNEIMRCRGSQFDPRVVEAFLDIYPLWVRQRDEWHDERQAA
jgi:putative nucleotidyltransferase with HDIG domain